jgi:hypothetical protein
MKPKTIWQVLGEHKGVLLFFYALFAAAIVAFAAISVYTHLTNPPNTTVQEGYDEISGSPIWESDFYLPFGEDERPTVQFFGAEILLEYLSVEQTINVLGHVRNNYSSFQGEEVTRISIVRGSIEVVPEFAGPNVYFSVAFNNDINKQIRLMVDSLGDVREGLTRGFN